MSPAILGALLLYFSWLAVVPQRQSHERKSRKTARTRKSAQPQAYWLIASAAACFAALLAKETAIILPVLIFASALIVPRGENGGADFRVRLRRALRQTVPFLCVTGLYLLMRFHALGGKLASRTQSLPWSTVLLSWPATLWFYVKVLLWPDHSRAFADPTLAQRFSFRGVIMPGLGVACVVAILALGLIWASNT